MELIYLFYHLTCDFPVCLAINDNCICISGINFDFLMKWVEFSFGTGFVLLMFAAFMRSWSDLTELLD